MQYKLLIIIFFLFSCSASSINLNNKTSYNAKGFAYIYNEEDYLAKIIKGKLDNSKLQVSHQKLKINTLVKIINPKTKEYVVIKNLKKIEYPDFYKILITKEIAKKLNLNTDLPLVEILEIKKNKSFVAKKAKIFNEEKKISSNAPVASVQISNISKNKNLNSNVKKNEFFILLGTFYSKEVANFLKERITKEIPKYDTQKLIVRKKSNKENDLISGPYSAINLMKNDYILLKEFGFEELDIVLND